MIQKVPLKKKREEKGHQKGNTEQGEEPPEKKGRLKSIVSSLFKTRKGEEEVGQGHWKWWVTKTPLEGGVNGQRIRKKSPRNHKVNDDRFLWMVGENVLKREHWEP